MLYIYMAVSRLLCCTKSIAFFEGSQKCKSATNISNKDRMKLRLIAVKATVRGYVFSISELDFEPYLDQFWPQNFFWAPPYIQSLYI